MGRPLHVDLSGKSEQARAVWSWSIVPICLHGKASGGTINGSKDLHDQLLREKERSPEHLGSVRSLGASHAEYT